MAERTTIKLKEQLKEGIVIEEFMKHRKTEEEVRGGRRLEARADS